MEIVLLNQNEFIYSISALSKKGVEELIRAIWQDIKIAKEKKQEQENTTADIILEDDANTKHQITKDGIKGVPVISLSSHELKNTWTVTRGDDGVFHVTGEKIEKFARRTDMGNYASVNRLRDILKKLGIRAELTNQGATQDSIIEISGKTFTLVEQY